MPASQKVGQEKYFLALLDRYSLIVEYELGVTGS
jgi:hypothetical protein